ncbi:BNR repeat-containing protein [Saccharothrix sp. HUAS TT1]|uniref:BNR repeat-containing protein n=1 Tax=unclassified Saccharothrix TaxID=2593673 RepID=UPI00345C54BB
MTAPRVTLVSDTELDASALFFVSYDGVVNNNFFQQDALLTHAGLQYATWYTASRHAVVARRPLDGPWEHVPLPHRLRADDSHNVISLGISPTDGALHVAMDTHDNRIFYTRSAPDVATRPWTPSVFGEVRRTLGGLDLGDITYPQFLVTPEGALQLSYRTGRSGDGVNELAEHTGGRWHALGAWSSATGDYRAPNGAVSTTRNMYLHGLVYDRRGRLHTAFTWREGDAAVLRDRGGLANHDTGYLYSDDRGRTWHDDTGATSGTTGGEPVGVSSPGIVVDPLGPDHGLMNQESLAVDSTGAPHVLISYVPDHRVTDYPRDRARHGRVFHLRRGPGGWIKQQVPVPPGSTQRTKLVLDHADNAHLVMPRGRIVTASRAAGWTDWTTAFDPAPLRAFGEVNVDTSRVAVDGVLSVQYQRTSTGATPSPIRVADFRLG